jgi:hypothetical protein
VPSRAEKRLIETCLAAGMTIDDVGRVLGRSRQSLWRHCKDELAGGAAKANSKVVGKLFDKCMKGDTIALLFWCKARLGWSEKARVEHTGADGGPVRLETVEAEANAFTQRIMEMASRFEAAPAVNDAGQTPESQESVNS